MLTIQISPNDYGFYTQQDVGNIRQEAYDQGFSVGSENRFNFTLSGLISALFMAPLTFVEKAFDFNIFPDVSFSSLFRFIFTICLCLGVIKFLMGMWSKNE